MGCIGEVSRGLRCKLRSLCVSSVVHFRVETRLNHYHMTILQIYLPEVGLPGENDVPLRYALRNNAGELSRSGAASRAELPRADQVEVIVPASLVLFTEVKLPPVRGQKLRQMLPYAVEDKILSDPELVQVATGERDEEGSTRVAVVDRGWLSAALQQLHKLGLRPERGYTETCMPELEANAWTLVWSGGEGFVRTAPGAGFALDSMGQTDVPLALAKSVDEARVKNAAPEKIIFRAADSSQQVPDLAAWTAQLNVPVVPGQDWQWAPRFLNTTTAINLLQGEFAPASSLREVLPQLKPILILAACIIAAQILATSVDWWRLNREKKALLAEISQTYRKAFPDSKIGEDSMALQMQRNLADLRRAGGQQQQDDFLPLLGKSLPLLAGVGRVETLSYDQGALKLDLLFGDTTAAENLKIDLIKLLPGATVEATNPKQIGRAHV